MARCICCIRGASGALAACLAVGADGAIIHVNEDAPLDPGPGVCFISDPLEDGSFMHPFDSIQQALNAAAPGDLIKVAAGVYAGPCNRNLDFGGKSVTVEGAGCASCVIDGGGVARAFIFDDDEPATAKVVDIAIVNCTGIAGGAVLCDPGSPTFEGCCFIDNVSGQGGAVAALFPSEPSFHGCIFDGNDASGGQGGAIYDLSGDLDIVACIFSDNVADRGGAIHFLSNADATLDGCTFLSNGVVERGGALFVDNGSDLLVSGCTFEDNHSALAGGAVFVDRGSSVDVAGSQFLVNGTGGAGGALLARDESEVILTQVVLTGNFAQLDGGGVAVVDEGALSMENSVLLQNFAVQRGGGVFVADAAPEVTVHGTDFTGNSSGTASGGAIAVLRSPLQISSSSFEGNTSNIGGGAVFCETVVGTVVDCWLHHNITMLFGGGLFAATGSDLTIEQCTFEENTALDPALTSAGGGVAVESSTLKAAQSTFVDNHAAHGAGLHASLSPAEVSFCIFETNAGGSGAGAYHFSPAVGLHPCTYRWTRFIGNDSWGYGGGIFLEAVKAMLHNCGFFGNEADDGGGAICATMSTDAQIAGSLFSCNRSLLGGGGGGILALQVSHVDVISSTLSRNVAMAMGQGGGMKLDSGAIAEVKGSILWENIDVSGATFTAQITQAAGGATTLTYAHSDLMGMPGCPSWGSICDDPLFVDDDGADNLCGTPDDDLSLSAGSPCIDAADNNALPTDVLDLDEDDDMMELVPQDVVGGARFQNDPATPDTGLAHFDAMFASLPVFDMGALEYAPPACPADLDGDGDVDGADFGVVLSGWGPCGDCGNCPADLTGDCKVDGADTGILLSSWGSCP